MFMRNLETMERNFYPINKPVINFDKLDEFFIKFSTNISSMNTTIAQRDQFISLSIAEVNNLRKDVLLSENTNKICESIHNHSIEQLRFIDSKYKRTKLLKMSDLYVDPVELSSGFDFVMKTDKKTGETVRTSIQRTFQFIPILKSISALFSKREFEEMYIQYNTNGDHICKDGVYEQFCCGDVYKSLDFFKLNPLALQLKLFVDDFEPCDGLKTKAGKHKTTAYYMQINNLPNKFMSKVKSILLVALCDATDAKNEYTNTNNVIDVIREEICELETTGITTNSGRNIKGTLICAMYDNLGGNILLGLHASFASNHYCRICLTLKSDCQSMTKENPNVLRTMCDYDKCVEVLQSNEKNKETFGVKSYCHLNDIKHFHIMRNISVDFMHDILEGLISFTLLEVFEYCTNRNIATIDQIESLVECFNFGELDKCAKPSKIKLDKKNLGQSASQSYCLFKSIPFILFKLKEFLHDIWEPVGTLLQILTIITSHSITECDVERLESLVQKHLDSFIKIFGKHLKPKQHLLLHYARVIRSMGPIVFFWVMRMESKHQFFKRIAQRTKNFINLKKTMALQHQENMAIDGPSFSNEIIVSKKTTLFGCCNEHDKYKHLIDRVGMISDNTIVVNSVEIDGVKYKAGYIVENRKTLCLIEYVVKYENRFWLLCSHSYNIEKYDSFLNSFLIRKIEDLSIFDLNESENLSVSEVKYLQTDCYIVVENLNLYNLYK